MTFYGQKRRTELFCQKRPTNIFATVAGKQLCWCLFLITVAAEFYEFFLNTFIKEHLQATASLISLFLIWNIFCPTFRVPSYTANIHLLKVNNRNTRKRYEICWKLLIKTVERRHCHRSSVFIINFEHISNLLLVLLLLT